MMQRIQDSCDTELDPCRLYAIHSLQIYIYMCVYLRVWLHTHVYKHERLIMSIHFCFVVETFGIFIFLIGIGIPFHSMTPKYLIDFYVRFWLWWVQIGCLSVLVVSLGGLHH